ncbi:beta-ketoacyl-ACP synthase II [Aquisalimonas sp.]|uniref:beta-ketoacyl-ACP synthase II n=1 Tax=Aquisalimonas sp. TaxID=1872621 RepID=UPI0025C37462|nr:beta-ketoacyl-ACP synthase II [Aquisalimonas sp.]
MNKRRVVVTGLGIISPVGNTIKEAWDNILAGRSGIRPIDRFDVSRFATRFAGTIRDFDAKDHINPKDARKMDPFIHYGIAAGNQALKDAGLEVSKENPERIGVAIGSGIGGINWIENGHKAYLDGGPRKLSPFFIPGAIINMVAGHLSIMHGMKGPNISIVTACTSGTHNIGEAGRMISYGDADVMVAGGTEFSTTPTGLGGFSAAKALSIRNDDPEAASRPWDQGRDGFVLSDGAGVVVLEEYEHARRRGAPIYAELAGYGMSGDAYHMTQPSEGGEGAARCMVAALRDAQANPDEVDYINAHGTSTLVGDVAESKAVTRVFGDHAYKLAVSSTKSMTGHLLGAAGGVEAVFTLLAMRDQVAPPTINLDNPDEECDLNYVPHTAQERTIRTALSNSFGFGGTNGTVLFRRHE